MFWMWFRVVDTEMESVSATAVFMPRARRSNTAKLAMRQHYIVLAGSYNRRDRVPATGNWRVLHCHQYLV